MAPTPIGPKCPQKRASRHDLMSGITGLRASMIGIRRKRRIRMAMTTKRQGTIVRAGEFISDQGMIEP